MLEAPELDPALEVGSHGTRAEEQNPFPPLLPALLLMKPSTHLAFWAVSALHQITLSFSSTHTPTSFSSGLLSY